MNSVSRLDALRWDPDGDGAVAADDQANYAAAFANPVANMGCPGTCAGYELTADLDFDSNGDGAVDAGDLYWNGGAGWDPINGYAAEFSGDGRRIVNVGLFGWLPTNATTGQSVGALAGAADGARIAAVFATGAVTGYQQAGGLLGNLTGDSVVAAAWTAVAVSSTRGPGPGGLAGHAQENAAVSAAYAIGTAQRPDGIPGHGTAPLSTNAALNGVLQQRHRRVADSISATTARCWPPPAAYANWDVDVNGDGLPTTPGTSARPASAEVHRRRRHGHGGLRPRQRRPWPSRHPLGPGRQRPSRRQPPEQLRRRLYPCHSRRKHGRRALRRRLPGLRTQSRPGL